MDKDRKIYVWATDKFLSGWGPATGKTHKQVAVCDNWRQADKMLDGFNKDDDYTYVNWSYDKPYFPKKRYTVTYRPASEFTKYKVPKN